MKSTENQQITLKILQYVETLLALDKYFPKIRNN